ncbi:MAG: hypothetical protein WB808_10865 [Candidatus Dormiibacterota bacterium]
MLSDPSSSVANRLRRWDDAPVRRQSWLVVLGLFLVAAFALAAGAFVLGSHNPVVTVVTADARVGDNVATAFDGGWAYGIPMDVAWLGTDNSWRQDGQPACLAWNGSPRDVSIQFGWVPVTSPAGSSWRQVVWVSCKS